MLWCSLPAWLLCQKASWEVAGGFYCFSWRAERNCVGRFILQITLPRNLCRLSLWNKWISSVVWTWPSPSLWTTSVPTSLAFLGIGRQFRAISRKPVLFPLAFWRKKNIFDRNTMESGCNTPDSGRVAPGHRERYWKDIVLNKHFPWRALYWELLAGWTFRGFGLSAKENVLDFLILCWGRNVGSENILSIWQLGFCDQCYCAFITGRERLSRVGGMPRNKRLGSTIHLQTNILYAVLLSYNKINRCSVKENKSGIR